LCGPGKIKFSCMAFTLFSIPSMAFPSPPVRKFSQYHTEPAGRPLHMRHGSPCGDSRPLKMNRTLLLSRPPAQVRFAALRLRFARRFAPKSTVTRGARARAQIKGARRLTLADAGPSLIAAMGGCRPDMAPVGGDLDSGGDSGGRRHRTGHPLLHALHHGGTTLGYPLLHALPPGDHLPPPCAGLHPSEGRRASLTRRPLEASMDPLRCRPPCRPPPRAPVD